MKNLFNIRGARRARGPRRRVVTSGRSTLESLEARALLAAGPLGLNLSVLDFVDVMKDVRDWVPAPNQTTVTRDANGWPTSDASITVIDDRVNMFWDGPDPNAVAPDISGTYHLSFQGQATVAPPSWNPDFTVQNQTYNPTTNTTTADLVVIPNDPFLGIDFTNTVNPASTTGAGVADVSLLQPGYAANTTQLFTNNYLNAIAPFGTFRYMDVGGTNGYPPNDANNQITVLNWSQRRLPSDSSQEDTYNGKVGVAWEYMIALANQTNTDMWINIPGPATDDYVRQLAQLIKSGDTVNGVYYPGLKPGLKVYLEYSNEVWGGIPGNEQYNLEATQQELAAGNSTLNNDGTTDLTTLAGRRDLERTMQITNIFRSVLGPDPTYATIRPVLGWQETNDSYYLSVLPWFESVYGAPNQYFYGIGNANYYGPTDYSSVDSIFNQLTASESATYATTQDYTTIAAYYGLKNVAYEGGPSVNAYGTVGETALAVSRDPRMEGIVANSYLNWYAAGGSLTMFFDGPYGIWAPEYSWNAAEASQAADPSLSPKYQGLMDVANASQVPVTAGALVSATGPTTFSATTDSLGETFTQPNTGQNSYWLLNVATAGLYNLSLTTGPMSGPNGQIEIFVNDHQYGGPINLTANGSTNLGNIPLGPGLSTLRIVVVHGAFDLVYFQSSAFNPVSFSLQPGAGPPTPTPPPTSTPLLDGGFESPAVGNGSFGDFQYDPTGTPWSFSGHAGVSGNGSGFTAGNPNAPEGTQVAFLQMNGSFSQVVTGLPAGSDQISFNAAQRVDYQASQQDFEVLIDGNVVGKVTPSSSSYVPYTINFTVAAGSHTIVFQGLDSAGGDSTAFIDNVQVSQAATTNPTNPPLTGLSDASFESPTVGTGSAGDYQNDPVGTPWTYSGQAGVAGNGSAITVGNPNAPVGTQVGFLEATGTFSQNVPGWAAGTYQIYFDAAQEANSSQQTFQVLVDGNLVGSFVPTGISYAPYVTSTFTVAAGTHTVVFQGLGSAGTENTALIDNIQVAQGTTPPGQLSDSGFEGPSVGSGIYGDFMYRPMGTPWAFSGYAGITGNSSGFTSGNPNAPEGTQVGFVQMTGLFSQIITGMPAGSYQISFDAAQRAVVPSQQNFQVLVDGNVVSTFTPAGTSYAPYTTATFTLGAGSHTVTFQGLDSVGGDNTAFIDNIQVTQATPPASGLSDAGFESPSVGTGSYGDYQYDPTGTPWAYSGYAGITGNGSGFTSGNPNAPEGTQVAVLQNVGSFSQVVASLPAGSYQISFDAAQRANVPAHQDFQVLVDGNVVSTFTPAGTSYAPYTTATFTLGAGSHTVTFQGLDSVGGDNTAFIDNIQITQETPLNPSSTEPADAGFESPSVGTGSYGDYQYDPTGTPWAYSGYAGVSGNGSGFTSGNPNAPEGTQVGFVQMTGSISQTISGWATGTYQISFDAAQRANVPAHQDFQVLVDGNVVSTFTPAGTSYAPYTTATFTLGAGSHTVTFQGLDSVGGDNTAFIDNIQFI